MKWNKWVVVFMALCTMLTVTSCLGDDDKYELSQDEMKQAMKAMKGTYTGKLKWQATSGVKYDSLNNVSYTVNDTAIIIHNFPVSSLAAGVLEGSANDSLRNAIKAVLLQRELSQSPLPAEHHALQHLHQECGDQHSKV